MGARRRWVESAAQRCDSPSSLKYGQIGTQRLEGVKTDSPLRAACANGTIVTNLASSSFVQPVASIAFGSSSYQTSSHQSLLRHWNTASATNLPAPVVIPSQGGSVVTSHGSWAPATPQSPHLQQKMTAADLSTK